jgi:cytochrome oxidase Cu insertion factor (SCO1/SenC/PrrC family)
VLTFVALFLAGCQSQPVLRHGTVYQPSAEAPPLALQTADGSTFSFDQVRGKTALVYFGYASCPDYCPATLATLDWMLDELGGRGDQVQVVFVSVDPERDSPEILQQYLDGFHPGMIGLTGDPASLKTALDGYGAMASTTHDLHPAEEGVVAHTTRLFVVDPEGRLRANYPFDVDRQDLLADISGLLDATAGSR